VYLALAPKSNAAYNGINAALADIRDGNSGPVPPALRDAHYPGAKALGHGKDYVYSHDQPHGVNQAQYLPDSIKQARYYSPTTRGQEAELAKRYEALRRIIDGTE